MTREQTTPLISGQSLPLPEEGASQTAGKPAERYREWGRLCLGRGGACGKTVLPARLHHECNTAPAPAGVAQWGGRHPSNGKVTGSIPGQGTRLACRVSP